MTQRPFLSVSTPATKYDAVFPKQNSSEGPGKSKLVVILTYHLHTVTCLTTLASLQLTNPGGTVNVN